MGEALPWGLNFLNTPCEYRFCSPQRERCLWPQGEFLEPCLSPLPSPPLEENKGEARGFLIT